MVFRAHFASLVSLVGVFAACNSDTSLTEPSSTGETESSSTADTTTWTPIPTTTGDDPSTTDSPTTEDTDVSTTDDTTTDVSTTDVSTTDVSTTDVSTTDDSTTDTTLAPGTCGDEIVDHDETCDDGNLEPGDGCNEVCQLEICGDGKVDVGEACDDGNVEPGDGCNEACELEVCGDSIVDPGEDCDDGANGDQDDGCTDLCQFPTCGDQFIQPSLGETCDDGPVNADDAACTSTCQLATCGDGLVQDGVEDCDDGNDDDLDACSNTCIAATCSDGLQNDQETGIDCGGPSCPACPEMLLLAGGNTGPEGNLGGYYNPNDGWALTPLAGVTVDGVALARTDTGVGVGLLRFTQLNDPQDNHLQFTVWDNATWSPVAQVQDFTTRGWPAISSDGAHVQALFQGDDFMHYATNFAGDVWSAAAATGTFGPVAGDIAAHGGDATMLYNNGADDNKIWTAVRTADVWDPPEYLSDLSNFNRSPRLLRTTDKGQLLGLWPSGAADMQWSQRVDGQWTPVAPVPGVTTTARVAVTVTSIGDVLVAYRGEDNRFHSQTLNDDKWSGDLPMPGDLEISGSPALATGLATNHAEAVIIVNGEVHHSHLDAEGWSTPELVGGTDIRSVALAR